jgi:hypothetical protein
MKKLALFLAVLTASFASHSLWAQPAKEFAKDYKILSVPYSVPDNDQQHFADVDFRFGWNSKKPYKIAIQFVNHSYSTRKLKFAIKDVTSKKMVLLDSVHNTRFGTETLKPNSTSGVWAGPIDNIKDSFSLHVWDSDGDEFDKVAISISDQQ